MTPCQQAALDLAAQGFPVLVVHGITASGGCTCGNLQCQPNQIGKHPRTRHGSKDATCDPVQIERWFKKWPDSNIAFATGAGWRVLDVDPRNGGDASLSALEAQHGPLPATVTVETGGGGQHFYFQVPSGSKNSCGKAGPGLDIKGEGGYVVAPPSSHMSGGGYRFAKGKSPAEIKIAPLPEWLSEPVAAKDDSTRDRAEPGKKGKRKARIDVPDDIARLIEDGVPKGKRSEAIHRVLKALLALGLDEPSIKAIMMDPDHGISEKPREKGAKWLAGEVARAREKLNEGFACDAKGNIVRDAQDNIDQALRRLDVKLRYDMFADQNLIDGLKGFGPMLDDAGLDRLWLTIDRRFHFRPSEAFFRTVIKDRARKNSFNPVVDYLAALKWDEEKRLDTWLTTYAGAKDSPYVRAVGVLPLIAAVRRVRHPGTKFDELLTFISPEGKDKSTALEILAVHEDWFCDDLPLNASSKELIEQTQGIWLAECADLKGIRKNEAGAVKNLLSRRKDKARLAYARLPSTVPRMFVAFGTTNDLAFLRSQTGNRRFWPVEVVRFDLEALRRDRDQLWAEAAHREAEGESIRLDRKLYAAAAEEQEARRVEDPFVHTLQEWLGDLTGKIKSRDVWELLDIKPAQRTQDHNDRMGMAMREIGWERSQRRFGGKGHERCYVRGTREEQEKPLFWVPGKDGEDGSLYDSEGRIARPGDEPKPGPGKQSKWKKRT